MTVRHQKVEIPEGPRGDPPTVQKARGHKQDAMQMVRDLQARIEVQREVMEEEQHEHARRHAQLQSVVAAKNKEAAELINKISLALECGCCFEKFGAGSVSFSCGHTYCNRPTCASRSVDTCPECRLPVTARVQLFGALPDVGGLLEAAVLDVQRLAAGHDKEALEEIHTERSEKDNLCQTVWQREREEMQGHVNRLQEEVLAAANDKKRSEEDRAVWQREREEEMHRKVDICINRLREEVSAVDKAKALLEEMRKRREEDRVVWKLEREEMQRQVNICWEEDRAVWQREREEFQGQVNTCINRLREEVLASSNAKALERLALQRAENCGRIAEKAKVSLEEMRKRSEEEKEVWKREREEIQQQVNKLRASKQTLSLLEEIHMSHHKRSDEDKAVWQERSDKAVWQRERKEILGQVNRLRVEVLAAENDNATLGDICKEHEEDKAALQREREEMQRQVNRLREEVLAAANDKLLLEEIHKRTEEDTAVWQSEREALTIQLNRLRELSCQEKAVWQREKEELKGQVNRLPEQVLAAAKDKLLLQEIHKRTEEDKAVWQSEREAMERQFNRLRELFFEDKAEMQGQLNILRGLSFEDKAVDEVLFAFHIYVWKRPNIVRWRKRRAISLAQTKHILFMNQVICCQIEFVLVFPPVHVCRILRLMHIVCVNFNYRSVNNGLPALTS
jgi:hypothetical protein